MGDVLYPTLGDVLGFGGRARSWDVSDFGGTCPTFRGHAVSEGDVPDFGDVYDFGGTCPALPKAMSVSRRSPIMTVRAGSSP